MEEYQTRVRNCLANALPPVDQIPTDLHQAMRYSVLGGGKRLRALLAYATGIALNVDLKCVDQIAVALELVHAYSLIHDDLPSMDNAELRHGQLTCHKQFNEALAILTGDALQTLAFEYLAQPNQLISLDKQLLLVSILSRAIGSVGMAGGQALDLAAEGKRFDIAHLATIHRLKTGALIVASVKMAASVSNCRDKQLSDFVDFAQNIGVAFQIQDDILDHVSSTETLGKMQGSDEINQKMTYVTLLGLDDARKYVDKYYHAALKSLERLPFETKILRELAEFIVKRNY